jgi:hypothetical protein
MPRPTDNSLFRKRAKEWLQEAEISGRGNEYRTFAAAMGNAYATLALEAKIKR